MRVAETPEIPDGTMKAVDMDGEWIALVDVAGKYYAIGDTCTHEEWSLSEEGTLEGHVVTCGGHGAQFDVRTGQVLAPPAILPEPSYEVKVEDGAIYVKRKK